MMSADRWKRILLPCAVVVAIVLMYVWLGLKLLAADLPQRSSPCRWTDGDEATIRLETPPCESVIRRAEAEPFDTSSTTKDDTATGAETPAWESVSRRPEHFHTTSAPKDLTTTKAETPERKSVSRKEHKTSEPFETTFAPKDDTATGAETPAWASVSRRPERFDTTFTPKDETRSRVETPSWTRDSGRAEPFHITSAPKDTQDDATTRAGTPAGASVSRRAEQFDSTSGPEDLTTTTAETPERMSLSRREHKTDEQFESTFASKGNTISMAETTESTSAAGRQFKTAEMFDTTSMPKDETTIRVETPPSASVSRAQAFHTNSAPQGPQDTRRPFLSEGITAKTASTDNTAAGAEKPAGASLSRAETFHTTSTPKDPTTSRAETPEWKSVSGREVEAAKPFDTTSAPNDHTTSRAETLEWTSSSRREFGTAELFDTTSTPQDDTTNEVKTPPWASVSRAEPLHTTSAPQRSKDTRRHFLSEGITAKTVSTDGTASGAEAPAWANLSRAEPLDSTSTPKDRTTSGAETQQWTSISGREVETAEQFDSTSSPNDETTKRMETLALAGVSRRAERIHTTSAPTDQASSRSETPEGTTISKRDLAALFATTSAPEDETTTRVETPARASVSRRSEPFDSTSAPTAGTRKREDKVCKLPGCVRASRAPPAGLRVDEMPQFVILTFDDAVNALNMALYRELLGNSTRKNKRNGCGITATFFVSGDYLDYEAVNELHSWGNEIALHTISRRTDLSYWRSINITQWEREVLDQREMLVAFANVSASDVTGFRGPFLFTGGDQGFSMLHKHFRYDSTLVHQRLRGEHPFYPYTMNFGFRRSCNVWPCPEGSYPGLWVLPINVLFPKPSEGDLPCAMADACLPSPVTANDTFDYLKSNFEDFYTTNRAPFPVFLHEAYLRHAERKAGYLRFVDWLLERDDVYLVTASEVLRFMENPKPLSDYEKRPCTGRSDRGKATCPKPTTCSYKNTPPGGERYMRTCSVCPKNYPWVNNPLGN